MLEWKTLGIIMIFPTILVAIYLTIKSYKDNEHEFWINLAICFWVSANAYWMLCEFTDNEDLKDYAGIPFVMGMLSVGIFYFKRFRKLAKARQIKELS
jgi:hypothetical protein